MAHSIVGAILLQCVAIFMLGDELRLQTSSRGSPLNSWISTASDIESEMDVEESHFSAFDLLNEGGLCGADGRLSSSSLSLEVDAPQFQFNAAKWQKSECGPLSATKFVGKTRFQANLTCQAQLGKPELVVDEHQTCSCCPIQCTPPVDSEIPGHNKTDPELANLHLDQAKAKCLNPFPRTVAHDQTNWLTDMALSTDRQCQCQCTVAPVSPFTSKSLYAQEKRCKGYNISHTFTNCNECRCAGSSVSMTAKKASCEKDGGVFKPEDCSCRCPNDKDTDLDAAKADATSLGHIFDPQCCCAKCGSKTGPKLSESEANCTASDMHEFEKSNGQCKCKCNRGSFVGKTLAEAKTQCKNDGGTTNASEVCRCNCKYEGETVQVEQARLNCAKKIPTQADSNGVFAASNGQCKCACGVGSEDGSMNKEVHKRADMCPSPQKFQLKDKACNCYCSDSAHKNVVGALVSARSTTCAAKKGSFVANNCTCYTTVCTAGKELEQPCCKHGETPAKDSETCSEDCTKHCGDASTKTNCARFKTTSADWKCLCPNNDKHFYFERNKCTSVGGRFTNGDCGCQCKKKDPTGQDRAFFSTHSKCKIDGGVFHNDTCDCLCTSHTGIYHGSHTQHNVSTVYMAKSACKGVFTSINGTCACAPLASEPCCNDGSGMLISQKKQWCSEQLPKGQWRMQGDEADCACVPPDHPSDSANTDAPATQAPTPIAPPPAAKKYFWAVVGDSAFEAHDSGPKKPECLQSTATSSHQSNQFGSTIGVTCCVTDGQAVRPDCSADINYERAKHICESSGLIGAALCTKEDIKAGKGKGSGCTFDENLVWTSDECTEADAEASAKEAQASAPAPAPASAPAPGGPDPSGETAPGGPDPSGGTATGGGPADDNISDLQQVMRRPHLAGFELKAGHAVKDMNAACNSDAATSQGNPHRYFYASNPMECAATCNSCGSCKAFVDNHKKTPKYCVFKMSSQTYHKNDSNNQKDAYIKTSTTADLELQHAANELEAELETMVEE